MAQFLIVPDDIFVPIPAQQPRFLSVLSITQTYLDIFPEIIEE